MINNFLVEYNLDTWYNMNELWGLYAWWNKPVAYGPNTIWFHLYETPRVVKLTESAVMFAEV